jgi:hypothetical protein
MTDQEEPKSNNKSFEEVLHSAAAEHYGEAILISGWVLVAEVITAADGDHALVTLSDSHTPPWDAYGMLQWASDEMTSASVSVEDDD